MKKILLSSIAGLAVIGSAFAVPSVEDRKALCEKYPDRYVWVAKDEMCVPINPCLSDNATIKSAYCIEVDRFEFPNKSEKLNILLERYAEKVLKSSMFGARDLGEGYVALITLDGSYHVINPVQGYGDTGRYYSRYREAVGPALWAYGYIDDDLDLREIADDVWDDAWSVKGDITETECDDIRDFASLLGDYLFDKEYKDGECWIVSRTRSENSLRRL